MQKIVDVLKNTGTWLLFCLLTPKKSLFFSDAATAKSLENMAVVAKEGGVVKLQYIYSTTNKDLDNVAGKENDIASSGYKTGSLKKTESASKHTLLDQNFEKQWEEISNVSSVATESSAFNISNIIPEGDPHYWDIVSCNSATVTVKSTASQPLAPNQDATNIRRRSEEIAKASEGVRTDNTNLLCQSPVSVTVIDSLCPSKSNTFDDDFTRNQSALDPPDVSRVHSRMSGSESAEVRLDARLRSFEVQKGPNESPRLLQSDRLLSPAKDADIGTELSISDASQKLMTSRVLGSDIVMNELQDLCCQSELVVASRSALPTAERLSEKSADVVSETKLYGSQKASAIHEGDGSALIVRSLDDECQSGLEGGSKAVLVGSQTGTSKSGPVAGSAALSEASAATEPGEITHGRCDNAEASVAVDSCRFESPGNELVSRSRALGIQSMQSVVSPAGGFPAESGGNSRTGCIGVSGLLRLQSGEEMWPFEKPSDTTSSTHNSQSKAAEKSGLKSQDLTGHRANESTSKLGHLKEGVTDTGVEASDKGQAQGMRGSSEYDVANQSPFIVTFVKFKRQSVKTYENPIFELAPNRQLEGSNHQVPRILEDSVSAPYGPLEFSSVQSRTQSTSQQSQTTEIETDGKVSHQSSKRSSQAANSIATIDEKNEDVTERQGQRSPALEAKVSSQTESFEIDSVEANGIKQSEDAVQIYDKK